MQKCTHVLRNPKLLSDLSQAPSGTEGPSGHAQGGNHEQFQALMKRLQADIADAADWDVVSSPQADIMRSVLGGSPDHCALHTDSCKPLSLTLSHVFLLTGHNMHQSKPVRSRAQLRALQRPAPSVNTLGTTMECSLWTRAPETPYLQVRNMRLSCPRSCTAPASHSSQRTSCGRRASSRPLT